MAGWSRIEAPQSKALDQQITQGDRAMKTFAKIVVSTMFLFASASAFAHGGGHVGMNGGMNSTMNGGNNSQNGMTTNTQAHNTSTKTGTTGNLSNRSKFFLQTEERILKFETNKLNVELARLQTQLGPNSPKVIALHNQILRDGVKLFQIETKLGQLVNL
jgi:hypothetical protein